MYAMTTCVIDDHVNTDPGTLMILVLQKSVTLELLLQRLFVVKHTNDGQ